MDKWIMANYRIRGIHSQLLNFHSHHEYEIYLFQAGECKYLINNRIYNLQPGDIVLLDGLTLHRPNPRDGSMYTRSHIHFSPTWIQEVLAVLGINYVLDPFQKLKNCVLRTGYDEFGQFVDQQIERLSKLLINSEKEKQQTGRESEVLQADIKLALVQLLVEIYKVSENKISRFTGPHTEKEQHAEAIAAWIDDHFTEKLTLDCIAGALNLSKYYASHIFKEVTGFTVMEYVMGCRVNQVKYLLEMEPNLTMAEISVKSGFESVPHFSRYFKEKVGMTPSSYRKSKQLQDGS